MSMKTKRIGICGSPAFTIKFFEALLASGDFQIDFALTNVPKPGNRMKLEPTAVANWATNNKIDLFEINKIKGEDHSKLEEKMKSVDCILIFAFGKIIPQRWLDLPKMGWLNIHPSKLPKWRGPSPIQYSILNGETQSAISLMKIDAKMDEGDLIAQYDFEINEHHNCKTVMSEIEMLAPNWVASKIEQYLNYEISPYAQEGHATYSHMISKSDNEIKEGEEGQKILNRMRAFGFVYLKIENESVKCFAAKIADENSKINILGVEPIFVQKMGGKIMHVQHFLNGLNSNL